MSEKIEKAAALQYDENKDNAPKLTAYGSRENAKQIIKLAQQNSIPIKKDEDLVNMLSQLELNKEIPQQLYVAVAEVFSFIYGISKETINEKENR
ncbi:MAG: EscU/YscU/HrcU family type III secretion system export apparatus switch protein [Campylobacterales bacterium]|nr:EscU/YscU/HrcU family type III secretion system export apparatus switch protein [Campylobacterales bacterium]